MEQTTSTMATSSGSPVRERARDELRVCHSLVKGVFEAHGQLLNGRPAIRDSTSVSAAGDMTTEPVQIMEKLIAQQKSLRKLVDEVIEHQSLNGVIEELRKANAAEDAKIAHLGTNLRAAESVLQNVLDEARPRMAALKRANKRPVDVDEVISYGSKISASLSAPAGWDPTQPLGKHLPPAPAADTMRMGKLAAMALEESETTGKPGM